MRVIGLAGWSGSGKTTLLRRLIPALIAAGHSVSTIKHAHHDFEVDKPGKDSWHHRQAGASEVLVAGTNRFALIHEHRNGPEATLQDLLARLAPVDLVLVEGFKRGSHPKIEIHREAVGKPLLYVEDPTIVAIAAAPLLPAAIPTVSLDDVDAVAAMVLKHAI